PVLVSFTAGAINVASGTFADAGRGGDCPPSEDSLHCNPGETGAMASRLLESMEDVRREAEHLSTVGGQGGDAAEARSEGEQSGASPEQAMALAEGEVGGAGMNRL
ncbi:hypothetical protein CYMTET_31319, partial [Cymbomonas tetramitiformis]